MRLLPLLLLWPALALASGPAVLPSPDLRLLPTGPGVVQGGGWHLACLFTDVTQDKCSDGRVVTDTRAGPAWCTAADGTRYQVGDNALCLGPQGGADDHPSVLNYVTDSTRPDLWTYGSTTVTALGDGYRLTGTQATSNIYSTRQTVAQAGDVFTLSCEMRQAPGGPASVTIRPGSQTIIGSCTVPLSSSWQTVSCTKGAGAAGDVMAVIETGSVVVDARRCQLTKTLTEQRRCDSGASPTTCPGDAVTLSTAGFPVAEGEVEVAFRLAHAWASGMAAKRLLSVRGVTGSAYELYIETDGRLTYMTRNAAGSIKTGPDITGFTSWAAGTWYRATFRWGNGRATLLRDGASVRSESGITALPDGPLPALAGIGNDDPPWRTGDELGGSIRILYIGRPRG